ncbi:MAG: CRISPR system precrRNA processing endoribonuclease RAMP protein Cas6 [[Clostridium] symbiosum]|uniref:CRISPR system precrRNA processing endoribonuclease RAMP protein Cas6 n=1 Tax=Clostridium symbiosum TaxID=1512 RepID=A0AAW5F0H7_CLOSY|nr:CRISPR system precrRNA processing endoribonuclease RAMP protein Cas6 [[Clostridium] symbiosum]MCI5673955.1 CRISPR system precrRNA processing endoribonuclease RAMP protein Cas6 [[Clostridium] symbiosum]MCK0085080.1 CRISPR system precrRNA processing endoribonuclease RAMP protein Cas6 [[Clostridium] symbiosum]MDB1975422.1 CRISPR system precrRNA processing endoribonuclease RAMP protein Cas6 [[Clostridium] symbiosum]MDB2017789.1 CRISPR system precrRNA processing endoribonuclease RAMP protein Cas6
MNPYTIYVYGQGKEKWEIGDYCVFDITLFGSGTEHAGVYLDALIAAEQKGWGAERIPFRLVHVTDQDSGRLIYAGGKSWIRNLIPRTVSVKERNAAYACLVFDTPLRVVSGNKLFQKLPFDMVIQFLTRRISLMTARYTDFNLEWDIEEMMRQAAEIRTVGESWKEIPFFRYSMNQRDGKLELASKMGWILYEGDLSPFVPVLELGSRLRLGKGATIGFGHYNIYYDK